MRPVVREVRDSHAALLDHPVDQRGEEGIVRHPHGVRQASHRVVSQRRLAAEGFLLRRGRARPAPVRSPRGASRARDVRRALARPRLARVHWRLLLAPTAPLVKRHGEHQRRVRRRGEATRDIGDDAPLLARGVREAIEAHAQFHHPHVDGREHVRGDDVVEVRTGEDDGARAGETDVEERRGGRVVGGGGVGPRDDEGEALHHLAEPSAVGRGARAGDFGAAAVVARARDGGDGAGASAVLGRDAGSEGGDDDALAALELGERGRAGVGGAEVETGGKAGVRGVARRLDEGPAEPGAPGTRVERLERGRVARARVPIVEPGARARLGLPPLEGVRRGRDRARRLGLTRAKHLAADALARHRRRRAVVARIDREQRQHHERAESQTAERRRERGGAPRATPRRRRRDDAGRRARVRHRPRALDARAPRRMAVARRVSSFTLQLRGPTQTRASHNRNTDDDAADPSPPALVASPS